MVEIFSVGVPDKTRVDASKLRPFGRAGDRLWVTGALPPVAAGSATSVMAAFHSWDWSAMVSEPNEGVELATTESLNVSVAVSLSVSRTV